MSAQTKGVDVLAVMDELITVSDHEGLDDLVLHARAALSELIGVAERAYAVLGVDDVNRRKAVQRDLRAALARCGGA